MRQHKFQACINTGDEGMSEDSSAHIPIVSCTDNMEILIHEVIPALVRLKPGFGWTWPMLYDRLNWCLDEDMSTIYTRIKDGVAQANLIKPTSKAPYAPLSPTQSTVNSLKMI
jgi:hypothetical protein